MIFIGPILETPIYLPSYSSENVKQKFTFKATVAKQLFSQVLQHWSSILLELSSGFKETWITSYLVSQKWEGGRSLAYLGWTVIEGQPCICVVADLFISPFYKKRICPGMTGFLFMRAKDSSVLRNTTEGLIRCWPNLNDISLHLSSERRQFRKWTLIKVK